jgi:protein-disulfide isomerase
VLLPLAFVLGLSVGYLFWGRTPAVPAAPAAAAQDQTTANAQPQVTRYDIPVDDDPVLGPQDAQITIIEFSDYECPYCRKWQSEVPQQLLAAYPGKIRLVYRDFPLSSIHPNALPAALAADCAGEQGAYWKFHDKLFSMELGLSSDAYQQYASELGLDESAFADCVKSNRYLDEVQADVKFATDLGIRSTPTFFINGIAVVGAQPLSVFQEVIDKELAGEIP